MELWLTNGTSGGTDELTTNGAGASGLFSNVAAKFTVLGDEALFAGDDSSGLIGLWVTNGTSAGTSELKIAGAASSGYGLDPYGITAFGTKALFVGVGVGPSGTTPYGLWVTEGTSAGTSEITVTGASSYGLFYGVADPDFTVFGNEVLFQGAGPDDFPALWVTNGTSAGTSEPGAVGAGPNGLDPSDITVLVPPSVPAPSGLSFAVAADKGTSGDTFSVAGKGEAGDTVTLYNGTTAIGSAVVAAAGTWSITTASPLAIGAQGLTAKEVDAAGNISPASAAQSITIDSATPDNEVVFVGNPGVNDFTGGPGNDYFYFSAANLANSDIVKGGGGTNYLVMTAAGTVNAGGVSGVEYYYLANGGANSLTVASANFTGVTGSSITIYGGDDGNTVNASALTGANRIIAVGGAGKDVFTGGAGNDYFYFSVANLANTDTVAGGSGTNYLVMTTPGTVDAGGVSGVEYYYLANGGANSLTLANANFTGVTGNSITIYGGNDGNTVNASALTGANRIIAVGGVGKDVFTGGAGNDYFYFTAANLANTDIVKDDGGTNYLVMTTAGTVDAAGVSGVEYYYLANGGANSLTLANANFTGVTDNSITIYGGNDGNTVNAAALTGANRIIAVGGAGKDVFTAGAGNDYFYFTAANLANTDMVAGGAGTNYLVMTTAGTVDAAGVSGVEYYYLANGGANSLTLANANFTGVTGNSITIYGGNDGNTSTRRP